MQAFQALKAGQRAAIKPANNDRIPAIHGEVASIEGDRIQIQVADNSQAHLSDYTSKLPCLLVWDERGRGRQTAIRISERNGESLVAIAQNDKEKREFPRVHSSAVFTYEVLAPDRVEAAAEDIRNTVGAYPEDLKSIERFLSADDEVVQKLEEEFSRVSHQMAELNSKVDYLIGMAEGRSVQRNVKMYREIVDFSGAGLSFLENKALPMESSLCMAIELSRFPQIMVHCLGEVVRCEPILDPGVEHPSQYSIGVNFSVMNEDDRERIIRHVFKIQRRKLRERKERSAR